jgi:hypothetical protein
MRSTALTIDSNPLPARTAEPPFHWQWWTALAGLFLVVFAIVALSGPGRVDIVDGQTRYEVARSLLEHGDSVIRDEFVWFAVLPGRDGLPHTNYRFPQTGLAIIAILAADATGPTDEGRRHFFFSMTGAVACAWLAVVYAVWFRFLGQSVAASLAWAAAGIFCTPSWYYGTSLVDDILGATALVPAAAAAFMLKDKRPWLGAASAGLLLGWAYNCKQPLGVFVLPVLAAAYRPEVALRKQLGPLALILLGLSVGVLGCQIYDCYKFPGAGPELAEIVQRKFGSIWVTNPLPGLASLAVSPSAGAIWYCPTLLLSFVGFKRWWSAQPWFCGGLLIATLGFTVFVSFLTFFKGDPCWGPRYLTPVFALWWVFMPRAAAGFRGSLVFVVLALGLYVQVSALSVDSLRFFLRIGLPVNYYHYSRWLGFDPATSHLLRRPWEIREILSAPEPAPEYAPAPIPTFSPTLPSTNTLVAASTMGHWISPQGAMPLNGVAILSSCPLQMVENDRAAVWRYHVFASLRPWCLAQQHLPPSERPVALVPTIVLFGGLGIGGLVLMLVFARKPVLP